MTDKTTVLSFLHDKLCEFINKLTIEDYNTLRVWHHKAADLIEQQAARIAELTDEVAEGESDLEAAYKVINHSREQYDELMAALKAVKPVIVRVSKASLERVPVYPADEIDAVIARVRP